MTREEIAVKLAQDSAFKRLAPERQKVVFEAAAEQAVAGAAAPTARLEPQTPLSAQELFPATSEIMQEPMSMNNMASPGGTPMRAAGAMALQDLPRLIDQGMAYGMNRLQGVNRPFAAQLRGGNIPLEQGQPARLDQALENVPGEILQAAGFGGAAVLASEAMLGAGRGIKAAMGPKPLMTVENIMRTPEARLPKLTQKERSFFFQRRGQQVAEQFATQKEALKLQKGELQKEMGKAAQQRSLQLRDQLPQAFKNQSMHYRQLVDTELAPVANEMVSTKELADFVKRRYAKDPETMAEVGSRLRLTNELFDTKAVQPVVDDIGQMINQSTEQLFSRSLGSIYQDTLNLGQQLPRGVRESVLSYGREEHFIDDTIDTLLDFLNDKQVNLSNARRFWKEWAPVRNQAQREFRPYQLAETQTGSASQRLIRLAKGLDPDNAVYAKKLAELLEIDDLPGPIKSVVKKLDSNQKEVIALRMNEPQAMAALNEMKLRVGQTVDRETAKWQKVKWALGLLGGGSVVASGIERFTH